MALAISPDENFEYVLQADLERPESERTTFTFRVPTGRDRLHINRFGRNANTSDGSIEEACYESVRCTLVAVSPTLKDSAGRAYPVSWDESGRVSHDWMKVLRITDALELGVQVLQRINIEDGDVEKSAPSPMA